MKTDLQYYHSIAYIIYILKVVFLTDHSNRYTDTDFHTDIAIGIGIGIGRAAAGNQRLGEGTWKAAGGPNFLASPYQKCILFVISNIYLLSLIVSASL